MPTSGNSRSEARLGAEHLARVERRLGPVRVRAWSQGQQATSWRIEADGAPVALLKVTADRSLREASAYAALADTLAPAMLVPLDAWPGGLLLPWSPAPLARDDEATHEAAGRFLARLERQTADDDDALAPPRALLRRFEAWWARGHGHLTPQQQRAMEAALDLHAFEGWPRVWCHRDFEARNWQVGDDGLIVLDWGQARIDLRGWDRLKLRESVWVHRPALAAAFRRGYGPDPRPIAERDLDQLALLHGLQTFVWGRTRHHVAFAELGARILARHLPNAFTAP